MLSFIKYALTIVLFLIFTGMSSFFAAILEIGVVSVFVNITCKKVPPINFVLGLIAVLIFSFLLSKLGNYFAKKLVNNKKLLTVLITLLFIASIGVYLFAVYEHHFVPCFAK